MFFFNGTVKLLVQLNVETTTQSVARLLTAVNLMLALTVKEKNEIQGRDRIGERLSLRPHTHRKYHSSIIPLLQAGIFPLCTRLYHKLLPLHHHHLNVWRFSAVINTGHFSLSLMKLWN